METFGYAALQLIPSLQGVQADMDRQLGAMMPNVGQKAGRSFSDGFARQAKAAVQITADVTATAMAGAAATGTAALVKGWDRLTTIQDAGSALTVSLGSSAEAAELLGDTLDVVRGTPFNLDQFAAGAQQLAGMNVEAGKVPGYLEAIGEASATQGGRAQEFADRLISTYGKISAQGQLDLESVWQISETGVNALAILANSFGVTRDEMKDMISDGAIPAGVALDAITDGILNGSDGAAGATLALSGTMEALRNNMSGAVSGISPALARLGAAVIEPFSPAVVAGANSLVDIIDQIGEEAGDLAQQVADSPGFDTFISFLENAPDLARSAASELAPMLPIVSGLGGALGAMGSGSIPILGNLLPTVNPVVAGIVALTLAVPEAREELVDLGSELAPVAKEFADRLVPVLADLADIAGDVLPPAIGLTGDALTGVLHVAMPLVDVVGNLTGFLADHEGVVTAVAAAYVGWRIADAAGDLALLGGSFDELAIKAYDALGSSAIVGNLELIGSGVKGMAGEIFTVPDATERMSEGFAAASSDAITGIRGIGSALASLTPVVAVSAVLSLAMAWQKAGNDAQAAVEDMKPRGFDDRQLSDVIAYSDTLQSAFVKAQSAAVELGDDGTWEQIRTGAKGTVEALTPLESSILNTYASLEELGAAVDENSARWTFLQDTYSKVAAEIGGFELDGRVLGKTSEELNAIGRWAVELDLDPAVMTVTEMADAIEAAVSPKAELIGMDLDEALTVDPKIIEANAKVVDEAMSAVSSSFASFGDILQLTDDPLDPKAAADARDAVADAEKRLAEARSDAAALESDATDKQRSDAMNRIADARDDLTDAKTSLQDLLDTDSPLDRGKIEEFYRGVIADTEAFSGNIQKAIEMGYDPSYVNRLLQAGPEQAGPVLEQLVGASSQAFIDMVNDAEATLTELSAQAIEIARLTQIAVNDQTAGGRQKSQDLDAAIAISQAMTELGEGASIDEIAYASRTGQDIVRRVAQEFNLIADVDTTKATEAITAFTTEQREALIGVEVIEADRRHAETVMAIIAQDRTAKVKVVAITDPETQKLIDKLDLGSTLILNSGVYGEENQPKKGPPRASGGPVQPGVLYPINEQGLEGFVPSVPGTVVPADRMAELTTGRRSNRSRRRLSRSEPAVLHVHNHGASTKTVSDALLFGPRT